MLCPQVMEMKGHHSNSRDSLSYKNMTPKTQNQFINLTNIHP